MIDLARLEREISHAQAAIVAKCSQRVAHPSHGITKAQLAGDYHRLVGMVTAWLYVSGVWDYAGTVMFDPTTLAAVGDAFGFDLNAVARLVAS